MTKHKHLTLSDRNDIQLGLERSETFKAIGQSILKDPTTVSKEVKRNRQVREPYLPSTRQSTLCGSILFVVGKSPIDIMEPIFV